MNILLTSIKINEEYVGYVIINGWKMQQKNIETESFDIGCDKKETLLHTFDKVDEEIITIINDEKPTNEQLRYYFQVFIIIAVVILMFFLIWAKKEQPKRLIKIERYETNI